MIGNCFRIKTLKIRPNLPSKLKSQECTVKAVQNDHSEDPQKVVIVEWLSIFNSISKCYIKVVVAFGMWSLFGGGR